MILSAKSVRDLLRSVWYGVITPYQEQAYVEGGLLNLKLDKVFTQRQEEEEKEKDFTTLPKPKPVPVVIIGVDERVIPDAKEVNPILIDGEEWFYLEPGVPYLLQSAETVGMPPGVEAKVCTRTSMFRGGGSMDREWVPFGFRGQLTVQFSIPCKGLPHRIQRGADVMALKFMWVDDGNILHPQVFDANVDKAEILDGYRGVYSGDRVTTEGKKERGT